MRKPERGGQRDAPRSASATGVLGALLDRSLVQLRDASRDARRFDRETIRAVSDVWDDNTFPLFFAATATRPAERERRAVEALTWMAGFGAERRAWMREQAAAAGRPLDALLPATTSYLPGRDHRGHVMAPSADLTADFAAALATGYRLGAATVEHLRAERAGRRLDGRLSLAVPRAYPTGDDGASGPAVLRISLQDLSAVEFDADDVRGAEFRCADGEVVVRLGTHGVLRAASARAWPDDRHWYASAAGRRADAVAPPRSAWDTPRPPGDGARLGSTAHAAAVLLRHAMFEMRSVRYPGRAPRVPVHELSAALAGAGEAVLAAGALRGRRRRERAFDELTETWARRGGAAFTRVAGHGGSEDAARRGGASSGSWPEAELRMASCTPAHDVRGAERAPAARFHFALPPGSGGDAPWRLRGLYCPGARRFRLRTEAFRGAAPLRLDAAAGEVPAMAFGEDAAVARGGGVSGGSP